jgi:hypothetical protein
MSPYRKPRKSGEGYVLPKKEGGVHRSGSGKVVKFKSAEKAKRVGRYIMALEHGMIPRKPR